MRQPRTGFSRWLWHVLGPLLPLMNVLALIKFPRFIRDFYTYRSLGGKAGVRNWHPCLFDRLSETGVDKHYFYQAIWALKKIVDYAPIRHVDVGSDVKFVGMITAVTQVDFVDIRPFQPGLERFNGIDGSILDLPFDSASVDSLSSLSVAEHIGLGRYGDPLDPDGTIKACTELSRVLAVGGNLYFGLPVGHARECFNAHRVYQASEVIEMFPDLHLQQFSIVDDAGDFIEQANLSDADGQDFANGLFHFVKVAS